MANGALPFGSLAGGGYNYGQDHNAALAMNAANYGNIYGGYQDLLQQQQQANAGIDQQYASLSQQVQQSLAGAEQGQREDIQAGATRAAAQNTQDLIGRGLGNSTVTSTLARGVEADKNRAVNNLVGQMAGQRASYLASLGSQRLQMRQGNQDAYNRLAQARMAMQERVNSPYPDAAKYAALAQQMGANRMAGAGMGGGGFGGDMGGGGMMQPRRGGGIGGGNGMVQQRPGGGQGNPQIPWVGGAAPGGAVGGIPGMGGGVGVGGGAAGPGDPGFVPAPGVGFGPWMPPGAGPGSPFPMAGPCPGGDCGGAYSAMAGGSGMGVLDSGGGYTFPDPNLDYSGYGEGGSLSGFYGPSPMGSGGGGGGYSGGFDFSTGDYYE